MPLWRASDQANSAPKFLGVLAKDKAYAQTANVTSISNATFTSNQTAYTVTTSVANVAQGNSIMVGLPSTQNVFPGQVLYSAATNATGSGSWSNGAITVLNIINTTAVTLSSPSPISNQTANMTFTTSNIIGNLTSTSGINVNMLINSNTVFGNLSSGAIVTSIINSTAVTMSQQWAYANVTSANVNFYNDGVRGQNMYQNTTTGAIQNGAAVGIWNMLNIPNIVTITANTISGNNFLTNYSANATYQGGNVATSYSTTAAFSQSNTILTGIASTANIAPGMAIYSTAANTTGALPVWANTIAVANVINSSAVLLSAPSNLTNASATCTFTYIAPGMIISGNNIPSLSQLNGTTSTTVTTITGTISNGTIGSNGNILNVTAFTGPPLAVGQEILANSTLAIANGTYVVSTTATNGIGNYVVSANSISNGASGATVTMSTVIPKVVSVNATTIVLSSNAYATGGATSNTITFSSYEKTVYGRSLSSGWVELKYGTGPITGASPNSTSTSGYSNGETIIVSGGTANGLLTITTNTQSGTAGANISSVAVAYPGYGFTNTGSLTYTYQRQIHLANVTATGTPSSYVAGDIVTVTCTYNLASFTGVITGNILTASSVTGTISVGNIIAGTGVAANTQILAQLSGTTGGAGTYAVSGNPTVASTSMTSTGQIVAGRANLTSSSVSNSTITITNQGLFTSGLTTANLVFTYSNSSGGTGTGSGITFAASFASASSGNSVNVTLGGRSGRVMSETIVALAGTSPYVTENAADNSTTPNS